jgi:type I restriction enzyme M protein
VDGSGLYRKGRNQNTLEPEHAEQILALYRDYRDAPGLAHLATLAEIERNDWNLNIPRYVEPVAADETITLEQALANLKAILADAYAAEGRLRELLAKAGLVGRL